MGRPVLAWLVPSGQEGRRGGHLDITPDVVTKHCMPLWIGSKFVLKSFPRAGHHGVAGFAMCTHIVVCCTTNNWSIL